MKTTQNNVIPKHCQENWLELSADEKVRFCTLCQKNIFETDITNLKEKVYLCEKYQSNLINRNYSLTKKILNKISKYFLKNRAN